MLTIVFDPDDGAVVPDNAIFEFVDQIITRYNAVEASTDLPQNMRIEIGSWMLLTAFRVAVRKGVIEDDKIRLCYKGTYVYFSKFGFLSDCPGDLGQLYSTMLDILQNSNFSISCGGIKHDR